MSPQSSALVMISALFLAGCNSRPANPIESAGGGQDVSAFALRELKGTRDGEHLRVQALYGDDSRTLLVQMQFNVTPPARLVSGTWTGLGGEGSVRERSITFLGGQNGPPSLGGRFDLNGSGNEAFYRIAIPVQPLKQPL